MKEKKDKSIISLDEDGECHGYQEWYNRGNNKLWYRSYCIHGDSIGYQEIHKQGGLQMDVQDWWEVPIKTIFNIK